MHDVGEDISGCRYPNQLHDLQTNLRVRRIALWAPFMGSLLVGSQFQNLLSLAATCDSSGSCTLPFAGSRQSGKSGQMVIEIPSPYFSLLQ